MVVNQLNLLFNYRALRTILQLWDLQFQNEFYLRKFKIFFFSVQIWNYMFVDLKFDHLPNDFTLFDQIFFCSEKFEKTERKKRKIHRKSVHFDFD